MYDTDKVGKAEWAHFPRYHTFGSKNGPHRARQYCVHLKYYCVHKKKYYSYGKFFRENNFPFLIILISRWHFLSSRCQTRRGYVTAKHMVSQNTRKSCRLVNSMNVLEKEKRNKQKKNKQLCPFSFVKAKTKERNKISLWIGSRPRFERQRFFLQPRRMATRNRRRCWTQIGFE